MITNGVRENNLASKITLIQEINVIASSLMFSVSLPVLLSLPEECSDGSTCYTLRTINAMLWLLLTLSYACSVTFSWVVLTQIPSIADTHLARWCEDHMVREHGFSTADPARGRVASVKIWRSSSTCPSGASGSSFS